MAEEKEASEIKNVVTIEDSGPCKKKVCIEVPEEAIKAALEKQYGELKRDSVVPGFRKGRAPLRLLEKRFGTDVNKQVKLKLLADASEAAVKDNKLDMLGDPDVDYETIDLPSSGPMKFDFEVEVRPEFELPELEGIAIEKVMVAVNDKMIDEELRTMCKRAGVWAPKEGGVVEKDNQIVADTVLIIEGVEEHEKSDNIEIFVREKGFISGVPVDKLDKLLVGAKDGDVRKTSVKVPKTFFKEDYRGKKIDIEIAVKEVKQLEEAELNEELFNKCGVKNLEELRTLIGDSGKTHAENQAKSAMANQVHEYLQENTEFDLPETVVADQSMRILQRQYSNMLMQGLDKEKVEEQMQSLKASSEEQANDQLKLFFIIDKIAEKFEIEVTEEEINGQIARAALSRGRRPEKMREELARDGSLAQFTMQIREQKCIEKILEKAKVTEVDSAKAGKKSAKKTTAKKVVKKAATDKTEKTTREDSAKKRVKKTAKKSSSTSKNKADKSDKKGK